MRRSTCAFPLPTDVLERIETERPDVIQVATPGPVGVCGLAVARLVGIPVVGSYHTELGPYALHLTHDALIADAIDVYVDWFYRQCGTVLAPTRQVAEALRARGLGSVGVWGRGVDSERFGPERRDEELRQRLLGEDAGLLVLSVGRLSHEKRIGVLLDAFALASRARPDLRLVVAGDGPARRELERTAPAGPSSPASWSATSSRRCMRARTSSASRARPTRSGRCCSRPVPPGFPSSRPPPAARSSSSTTAAPERSSRPTSRACSPPRCSARGRPGASAPTGRRGPRGRARAHLARRDRRAREDLRERARPRPGGIPRRGVAPPAGSWQALAMIPGSSCPAGALRLALRAFAARQLAALEPPSFAASGAPSPNTVAGSTESSAPGMPIAYARRRWSATRSSPRAR